jgi:Phosphotransferase enzyme family
MGHAAGVTSHEPSSADGRLSPTRLWTLLDELCAAHALDPTDARLIKFTNSAVFDLPRADVVIKVAGSALVTERIPTVIRVARWLEAAGFPAVRLVSDLDQPVLVQGHAATVWQRVAATGREPTGEDLAGLLQRFHALRAPDGGLPRWDPIRSIRRRLAEADGPTADELAFLRARCDEVEVRLAGLTPSLAPGAIHGDAFLGNLIPGPHGPVLCDFDSTSIGCREWDLTPVAVGSLRFDYANDPQPSFASAYGFDVTTWSGFAALRQLRELQLVTSVLPVLRSSPPVRSQFEHRLATLRSGSSARWQPYARAFEPD